MSTESVTLPITENLTPETDEQVAEMLRAANDSVTPVYPIGGGTSLGLGLPAKSQGIGLQLASLNRVIDYPARDMTITAGAGITIETLQQTLAPEGQRLPIDAPVANLGTLGGLIASNHSGPLRFGHGTMRDHVIGIRAVDGRGQPFAAGGRVVKNVAGYDFCKLLTGSLGTLGVITEVTLKLKPVPPAKTTVVCRPQDLAHAERLLAALIDSHTDPVSVELLVGPEWNEAPGLSEAKCGWLVVGFEGTQREVDWMSNQLASEWHQQKATVDTLSEGDQDALYQRLVDFPADQDAALLLKLTGLRSGMTHSIQQLLLTDDRVGIQSHAGNGIVIAKFSKFPEQGLSRVINGLKSTTALARGSVTILSNPSGNEMTPHSVWGIANAELEMMKRVKAAFDPNHILNPGRFVY